MKTFRIVKNEVSDYLEMTDGEIVSIVPFDEGNADYQRYLNPEAEQSTPLTYEPTEPVV
jgi:hypothetical protein